MKKLLYILIALVLMTSNVVSEPLNKIASNSAANIFLPLEQSHTQQIAKVYWLPDFLGNNAGHTKRINDGGKNEVASPCLKEKPDTNLYDFTQKMQNAQMCYIKKCKAKFKYTSANCSGEYQVAGNACEGNYESCVGKPCSNGGYFDAAQTNKKCSPVTYGGKTCQSCYTPTCSEGGFQTGSSKTGYICSATTYYGQTCYSCVVDPCYGLTEPAQPYGCKSVYAQCPSKCDVAYPDNCHNRTAVSVPYGCQSAFGDCSSKCEVAYPDNCRNRTHKDCEFGCAGNYGDCAAKCESCKTNPDCAVASQDCPYGCESTNSCGKCTACKVNPDCSVTEQSCPYGCATTNSCGKCTGCKGNPDCSVTEQNCPYGCASTNTCDKCTSCKQNPCDLITSISVPANGYCSATHATCSTKCLDWECNSGYEKSGDGCVLAYVGLCESKGMQPCQEAPHHDEDGCISVDDCCFSYYLPEYSTKRDGCYCDKSVDGSTFTLTDGGLGCLYCYTNETGDCGRDGICFEAPICNDGPCVDGGSRNCTGSVHSCGSDWLTEISNCVDCQGKTRYICNFTRTCQYTDAYPSSCAPITGKQYYTLKGTCSCSCSDGYNSFEYSLLDYSCNNTKQKGTEYCKNACLSR